MEKEKLIFGAFLSAGALVLLWPRKTSFARLIDPGAVRNIASSLPVNGNEFVFGAWDWVASKIGNVGFYSNVYLNGDVVCDDCYTPSQVLRAGRSNCLGKSALLASILRNRMPADSVYVALGQLKGIGGHAWPQVRAEDGQWYILESTHSPKKKMLMSEKSYPEYVADAFINDQGKIACRGGHYCLSLSRHG